MSYQPNQFYTNTPCTPVNDGNKITLPPNCSPGYKDFGIMPSGSCVTYDGQPGWRRICSRQNSLPSTGVSNVECCMGSNSLECQRRGLTPYNTNCDRLMQYTCNASGSTDCDKYLTNAPDNSWYDNRNYQSYPRPYNYLSQYNYSRPYYRAPRFRPFYQGPLHNYQRAAEETSYFCERNPQICYSLAYKY